MSPKVLEAALNKAYPHKDYKFCVRDITVQHSLYSRGEITITIESYSSNPDMMEWFNASLSSFIGRYKQQVRQYDYDTQILGGAVQTRARIVLGSY